MPKRGQNHIVRGRLIKVKNVKASGRTGRIGIIMFVISLLAAITGIVLTMSAAEAFGRVAVQAVHDSV